MSISLSLYSFLLFYHKRGVIFNQHIKNNIIYAGQSDIFTYTKIILFFSLKFDFSFNFFILVWKIDGESSLEWSRSDQIMSDWNKFYEISANDIWTAIAPALAPRTIPGVTFFRMKIVRKKSHFCSFSLILNTNWYGKCLQN